MLGAREGNIEGWMSGWVHQNQTCSLSHLPEHMRSVRCSESSFSLTACVCVCVKACFFTSASDLGTRLDSAMPRIVAALVLAAAVLVGRVSAQGNGPRHPPREPYCIHKVIEWIGRGRRFALSVRPWKLVRAGSDVPRPRQFPLQRPGGRRVQRPLGTRCVPCE